MVFRQASLENTNWNFDMSASKRLATRALISWDKNTPITRPETREKIPMNNVSRNSSSEIFCLLMPRVK